MSCEANGIEQVYDYRLAAEEIVHSYATYPVLEEGGLINSLLSGLAQIGEKISKIPRITGQSVRWTDVQLQIDEDLRGLICSLNSQQKPDDHPELKVISKANLGLVVRSASRSLWGWREHNCQTMAEFRQLMCQLTVNGSQYSRRNLNGYHRRTSGKQTRSRAMVGHDHQPFQRRADVAE